jgi:microcystin-dependent protein
MSNYTYKDHYISAPPGSISTYLGGGTTTSGTNPGDPDGWVICDGQLRTVSDGRFANLAAILNTYMGVSTNTSNSITPPDLKTQFIRGCDSAATNVKATGGSATISLSATHLPAHGHTIHIGDGGHRHSCPLGVVDDKNFSSVNGQFPPADSSNPIANYYYDTVAAGTGITATSNNTGSGAAITIVPPFVTMNYIMKY